MISASPASGGRRTLATCAALMCTALFLFGAVFALTGRIPAAVWICIGAGTVPAAVLFSLRRPAYAIALLLGVVLAVRFAFFQVIPAQKLDQREGVFVLRADSGADLEYGSPAVDCTLLYADGVETKPIKVRLFLSDSTPPEYEAGDRITVLGKITLSQSLNRLSKNNTLNLSQTGTLTRIPRGADSMLCRATRFSEMLGAHLRELLPDREGALLCALLTGDRGHFDTELDRALKKSGLAHIAAVSGMHVSVITALLCSLLGKKPGVLLSLPLLPVFAAMTGFSPSVIRAVIMSGLAMLAFVSRSQYDPLTSLLSAAAVLAGLNPFVVFSPSFLLSFFSTFGIVAVGVRLSYFLQTRVPARAILKHTLSRLFSAFSVSVAAYIFTLPLQLMFFSEVPLNSLLSNLLAVWAVPWAMFMGIFLVPLCALFPFASQVFCFVTALPLRHIIAVARLTGETIPLTARSDNIFLILTALGLVVFGFLYYRGKISGKACACFGLLLCALCLVLSAVFPMGRVCLYGESGTVSIIVTDKNRCLAVNAPVSYGGRQFTDTVLNGRRAEMLILTDTDYRASGAYGDIDAKAVYSPAPDGDIDALVYSQSGVLEGCGSRAELIHNGTSAALRLITRRCTLLDVTAISPFDELPDNLSCDLLIIDGELASAPTALRHLCAQATPSVVFVTAEECDTGYLRELCACEVVHLDQCGSLTIR